MTEQDQRYQERRLDEILGANLDPVAKTRQIIRLGFDPEVADEIVERHQLGARAPVYYESLNFADFSETEEPERHRPAR